MARKKVEKESQSLEEIFAELNKTYGKGTILSLEDKQRDEYDVISSGSIGIDYIALGVGGFVKGKIYEIRAWEGAGKSTLAGTLAANCQKAGGRVLYIDSEQAVDKNYFKALGVDTKNLVFSQPDYGEEGFEILEKLLKSGEFDLAVIDSDNGLLPKAVIENPMSASNIGKKAHLNSTAYPKIKLAMKNSNCCLVVISQYREKIGVMFGDPKVTQGGHALKYVADSIIELTRKLVKDGDETLANDVKFKTIKNKTFPPYKDTRFDIVFGTGIDKIGELITLAIEYGVIEKSGASYKDGGESIARGEEAMRELLGDNVEFYEALRERVIRAIKNPIIQQSPLEERSDNEEQSIVEPLQQEQV